MSKLFVNEIQQYSGSTVTFSNEVDVIITGSLTLGGQDVLTNAVSSVTSDPANSRLVITDALGSVSYADLSVYIDDTNLPRITGATLDGTSGIVTFTRDDASTFTADFSDLLDDTNDYVTSAQFNDATGVLTLTRQNGGIITADLDGRYLLSSVVVPNANISEASVTQHEAALTITESQIDDLKNYALLSDISLVKELPAGGGNLTYNNGTGVFTYTPPDIASFVEAAEVNDLTANVTWANVPDANITSSSVTQHEGDLSINESQITFTSSFIQLTDLSVGADNAPSGGGGISYDNTTGVFTYTPAAVVPEVNDLTTAVVWANVPNANITESSVTQHQGALAINENQISFTSNFIELTDLSAATSGTPSGAGSLSYDNATGVFTYVQPDLSDGNISYDNSTSGLTATNVHAAIDELNDKKLDVSTLTSSVVYYPTTASSDIATYSKLVTTPDDIDFNSTAVDVPTGLISGADQLIASLASVAGTLSGSTGRINIHTIGNIRQTEGNSTAFFYFEVYKRNSLGAETLLAKSSNTSTVSSATYQEFFADAIIDSTPFTETDRVVLKFYGTKVGTNTDPNYDFQFGGAQPVRSLFPVPVTVIPHVNDADEIIVVTSNFSNVLSGTDDNVQSALDTIDDIFNGASTEFLKADGSKDSTTYQSTSEKGQANGYASLDANGHVPASQLPSFVDDVVEATDFASLPTTGEAGKIYVTLDTNNVYRWSGSAYIQINNAVSTSDEADKLATARDFSITGDVIATAISFDGTANVELSASVTEAAVTQHEAALSISEGQISDLKDYILLSDLSATNNALSSGEGSLAYNSATGQFVFTRPDLSQFLTSYTETDPIYTTSSWYTTTNNSTNWDTAFSWGNHADAGYLTSLGNDVIIPESLSVGSASSTDAPVITSISSSAAENIMLVSTTTSTTSAPDLVLFKDKHPYIDGEVLGKIEFRGNNIYGTDPFAYNQINSRVIDASQQQTALTLASFYGSTTTHGLAVHTLGDSAGTGAVIINAPNETTVPTANLDVRGDVVVSGSITAGSFVGVEAPNNNTVTLTGQNGVVVNTPNSFTLNQAGDVEIFIQHGDTSALDGNYGSLGNRPYQIHVDGNGHVTSISTTGLVGYASNDGVVISAAPPNYDFGVGHGNTSNLSGTYGSTSDGTKIDTITVDEYGHVTAITTGATGSPTPTLDEVINTGSRTNDTATIGALNTNSITLLSDVVPAGNVSTAFNTSTQDTANIPSQTLEWWSYELSPGGNWRIDWYGAGGDPIGTAAANYIELGSTIILTNSAGESQTFEIIEFIAASTGVVLTLQVTVNNPNINWADWFGFDMTVIRLSSIDTVVLNTQPDFVPGTTYYASKNATSLIDREAISFASSPFSDGYLGSGLGSGDFLTATNPVSWWVEGAEFEITHNNGFGGDTIFRVIAGPIVVDSPNYKHYFTFISKEGTASNAWAPEIVSAKRLRRTKIEDLYTGSFTTKDTGWFAAGDPVYLHPGEWKIQQVDEEGAVSTVFSKNQVTSETVSDIPSYIYKTKGDFGNVISNGITVNKYGGGHGIYISTNESPIFNANSVYNGDDSIIIACNPTVTMPFTSSTFIGNQPYFDSSGNNDIRVHNSTFVGNGIALYSNVDNNIGLTALGGQIYFRNEADYSIGIGYNVNVAAQRSVAIGYNIRAYDKAQTIVNSYGISTYELGTVNNTFTFNNGTSLWLPKRTIASSYTTSTPGPTTNYGAHVFSMRGVNGDSTFYTYATYMVTAKGFLRTHSSGTSYAFDNTWLIERLNGTTWSIKLVEERFTVPANPFNLILEFVDANKEWFGFRLYNGSGSNYTASRSRFKVDILTSY